MDLEELLEQLRTAENAPDLSAVDLRNLIELRTMLRTAVDEIAGENDEHLLAGLDDTRTAELDRLLERSDLLDGAIDDRENGQRDDERTRRLESLRNDRQLRNQTPPGGNGGRRNGTTPTHGAFRGTEPGEGERDIVENVDSARYSLSRAIRAMAHGRALDGLEAEVSQEMARRTHGDPNGFFIPPSLHVDMRSNSIAPTRALDTTAMAGEIPTIQSGRFIDVLRNRLVLVSMGAEFITGVVGELDIPKQSGEFAFSVIGEDGDAVDSDVSVGVVKFTPRTGTASTYMTRRMLAQTGNDTEVRTRRQLLTTMALGLDLQGVNGSGAGNNAEGLLQNAQISTVAIGANGGDPTLEMVVGLEAEVAAANADIGTMGYVTSAKGRGKLRTTQKFAGTNGNPLWSDDNQLNGYQAMASQQIPSNLTKGSGEDLTALLFGNFNDAAFALWTAIDVMVDPYSSSKKGGTHVYLFQDFDFQVLRPESFAKCVDMATL